MKALLKRLVLRILKWEARVVLARGAPKIIAITGSVGKTSTKDAIYSVVGTAFTARRSPKSYNGAFGVPLSILDLRDQWGNPLGWLTNLFKGLREVRRAHSFPEWLILEAGVSGPGDIDSLTSWLRPDIVVLTSLPDLPAHVGRFASAESVIEEKQKLVTALGPDGLLIVNHDEERTRSVAHPPIRKITYGMHPGADVRASNVRVSYGSNGAPCGMQFQIEWRGESIPCLIRGVVGEAVVVSTLPAVAIGGFLGMNSIEMESALAFYESPPGRMRILEGANDTVILDDSYNASPVAVHTSLETLARLEVAGRRIVILGDMLELGSFSQEAHENAGLRVAEIADVVVTVGERAELIAKIALASRRNPTVVSCCTAGQAGEMLRPLLRPKDVVLVKGSQSVRLERCVIRLLREPEQGSRVLVRQERAWIKKP